MDTAFQLKLKYDSGELTTFKEAKSFLENSLLITELKSDFEKNVLNILNRMVQIVEIPFAHELSFAQQLRNLLADKSFCNEGFSLLGKADDILSCYNSMIVSVLLKSEYEDVEKIKKGINWILEYQHVERTIGKTWYGKRAKKYGGCLKEIPCYIGVVKATIALSDYKLSNLYRSDEKLETKLKNGLEYILSHELFKRKSNGEPITKDILKVTYPFTYKTNVIEILRLMKDNQLLDDPGCEAAKQFLKNKRRKDNSWRINSSYLPKNWIKFDKPNEPGYWISHEIETLI